MKLKKNWIWDVLEIDWSNVSITLNDNEINLPRSLIIPFKKDIEQESFLGNIRYCSILCSNRERHGLA